MPHGHSGYPNSTVHRIFVSVRNPDTISVSELFENYPLRKVSVLVFLRSGWKLSAYSFFSGADGNYPLCLHPYLSITNINIRIFPVVTSRFSSISVRAIAPRRVFWPVFSAPRGFLTGFFRPIVFLARSFLACFFFVRIFIGLSGFFLLVHWWVRPELYTKSNIRITSRVQIYIGITWPNRIQITSQPT